MSHARSLNSSGSEFQTVEPATGKAQWPYVLSQQHGTISQCRYAKHNRQLCDIGHCCIVIPTVYPVLPTNNYMKVIHRKV